MYLIDFIQSVGRKSNIPQLIYLALNVVFICFVTSMFFAGGGTWGIVLGIVVGILLYGVSLAIALSSYGEAITRYQTGCKEITDENLKNYVMPIFNEVYQKAREKDPTIAPDVQLYVSDDEFRNAFATGRKTVCMTRGIIEIDPEQLKAVLAHEFGHLAHKDTDMLQVINVGNLIITVMITVFRACIIIGEVMMKIISIFVGGDEGVIISLMSSFSRFLSLIFVAGLTKLWTWLGMVLCMKSSRGNEFEADAFSTELGYGRALIQFFNENVDNNPTGLFATLAASHPDKDDRIVNIIQVYEAIGGQEMEQQQIEEQPQEDYQPAYTKEQSYMPAAAAAAVPTGFGHKLTPMTGDDSKQKGQSTVNTQKGGFKSIPSLKPSPMAAVTDKYKKKDEEK